MKWVALTLAAALGAVTLTACEDTYGDYGYSYGPGYYGPGYYGPGYYGHYDYHRGYYDSYGHWRPYVRDCDDPDQDCD